MNRLADRPIVRRIRWWSLAASAALLVLSVLSFLGTRHWAFELLTHFRVQFAALALALLAISLLMRRRYLSVVLGILAIVNGFPVAAYVLKVPVGGAHAAADGTGTLPLTVSYHNLRNRAADYDRLFAHLDHLQTDVLVLTELDYGRRADLFHGLRSRFPYFASTPGPSIFNVAVFSRFPLTEASRMLETANNWPMLHVRICPEAERRCLRVVTLHAHPPVGRFADVRNTAMEEAARTAVSGDEPVIVVGDLNCTPWSPYFTRMLRLGSLRDGNRSAFTATWGSRSPFLGLLIDHILVGPGVREKKRRVGPAFGSDHFMLTADLEFEAPPPAEDSAVQ